MQPRSRGESLPPADDPPSHITRYCGLGNHRLREPHRPITDPKMLRFAKYLNPDLRSTSELCHVCHIALEALQKSKTKRAKILQRGRKRLEAQTNSISDVSLSQRQSHISSSSSGSSGRKHLEAQTNSISEVSLSQRQSHISSSSSGSSVSAPSTTSLTSLENFNMMQTSQSSSTKRRREDEAAHNDSDDDSMLSLNAVNGTRLPHIQPIPKRRQTQHLDNRSMDIYLAGTTERVMGCITSTNKLHELRQDNVFRVRVAHLQPSGPEAPIIRSGFLELTPRELVFLTPGYDPIVWALQHLRRYGLNGDLFSFEAGRRCMSGPGIYTFRIHNAEQLYPMFQRYINAVNTDAFAQVERERERVNSTHSVSVLMGRSDVQPHSNNYLEPAPMMARAALQVQQSTSEETANAAIDSPEMLPNLQLNMGEQADGNLQSPITPGAYINTNTNVYFDQQLHRLLQDQNSRSSPSEATPTSSNSGFSTMRRQQPMSADLPPQESAPALNETLRLYANVETPRERQMVETSLGSASCSAERCYENVNRLDLPLLPRDCSQQSVSTAQQQQQLPPQPLTPTSLPGVNYIVLDLDQPRSPAQSSPKTVTNGFGSGLSLTTAATAPVTPEGQIALDATQLAQNRASSAVPTGQHLGSTPGTTAAVETVATQGYSTIDFIRTYALNKSSTAPTNHDGEVAISCQQQQQHQDHMHEDCELRITRHSKCVRKAYSISE